MFAVARTSTVVRSCVRGYKSNTHPPRYENLLVLTDGSTIKMRSNMRSPVIRLSQDTRNTTPWNEGGQRFIDTESALAKVMRQMAALEKPKTAQKAPEKSKKAAMKKNIFSYRSL
eukprot:Colp12_sorted_trinity150504_noHs@13913